MVDYYSCKMSGSDDEFEPQIQTGMSKAELRRSNKPIMEKKRRQRINNCLDELKSLILEAMKKDPTRHSKLEKADILEMTVKHLQQIQRQQLSTAVATDPAVLTKFRSGFSECANEVSRYVNHLENVDPTVKQRLVSHLNNCVSNLQQVSPFYNHYVPYMPERLYPEVKVGFQSDVQSGGGGGGGGDENNNGSSRIQIPSNVQLIPSRLPTGELALLVPPSAGISASFPFFPPASEGPTAASRIGTPSAFTAVQRSHSPLLSPSTSTSSFEENQHSEQYPGSLSPPLAGLRFKVPEQSPASSASSRSYSSPETQKPQISSSSDRQSPPSQHFALEQQRLEAHSPSSRQPLSVITDKYNRTPPAVTKREAGSLKRHHSDSLLLPVSEKKPRYLEPTTTSNAVTTSVTTTVASASSSSSGSSSRSSSSSSSSGCRSPSIRIKEEFPNSSDELRPAVISNDTPTTPNGDMWRPW